LEDIASGSYICSIPGYLFSSATTIDHHRHYVWEYTDYDKRIDSTCLKGCIVMPDGFGQYINTSHPFSDHKIANAQFECSDNFKLNVKSILNIKKGEEILCDYHWQLAVIDPNDGLGESSAAIAAGEVCICGKCDESRLNYKSYCNVMKGVSRGRFSIWERSSAHVSQQILLEYFQQKKLELQKSCRQIRINMYLLKDQNLHVGVGMEEFSWRSVLDTCNKHPMVGGRLVQVSSTLGMEALLAALYKPELELSMSVMVSSTIQEREVRADDVAVAINTFRQCLLSTSTTFQSTLVTGAPSPATVITPFDNCWSTIGMTHLVIGEGADDTPEGLDVDFAMKIIDAAEATLVYVLTSSNDLQNYLLLKRGGWCVSPYRQRRIPNISSLTGETIFFAEIYKDPRRLRKKSYLSPDPIGFEDLHKRIILSGMQSSAELLRSEKSADASFCIVDVSDDDSAVRISQKRKGEQKDSESELNKKPCVEVEDPFNLRIVKAADLSMLNLTWGMILADKYFDPTAEGAGFAKAVKISELSNVRETLKALKSAVNLGYPQPVKEEFKIAMSLWFIEAGKERNGWFSDINISILTTLTNVAIKSSALATECVMAGPYFFIQESPSKTRWNKCFPHMDFKDAKIILVPAHVTSAQGSEVKNHYSLLHVDIPGMKITVFDSMPAKKRKHALWRIREYIASITGFVNSMREEEDGESKPWEPEIEFDDTGLLQQNFCDCGVFTTLIGLYLGMGRCAEDVLLDFNNDGTKMRLFLASIVLDAATEGMPPPAPRHLSKPAAPRRQLNFDSSTDEDTILDVVPDDKKPGISATKISGAPKSKKFRKLK
jgi:hypothetical protein